MSLSLNRKSASFRVWQVSTFILVSFSFWILSIYVGLLPTTTTLIFLSMFTYIALFVVLVVTFIILAFTQSKRRAFISLSLNFIFCGLIFWQLSSQPINYLGLKVFRLEYESLAVKALSDQLMFESNGISLKYGYYDRDSYVQLPASKFYLSIKKRLYVTDDRKFAYFVHWVEDRYEYGSTRGYVFSKNSENPENYQAFGTCFKPIFSSDQWYWCSLPINR